MTSNVVGIRGQALALAEPNKAAIEVLEDYLVRARSGDVIGVAIAASHSGNATTWQVGGIHGRGTIGVLEVMKVDMIQQDLKSDE